MSYALYRVNHTQVWVKTDVPTLTTTVISAQAKEYVTLSDANTMCATLNTSQSAGNEFAVGSHPVHP